MAYRRLIPVLFLLITTQSYSQKYPVIYGGFDYFRDTGFEGNFYGNLSLGSQLYQWKFLAPEIGINYYTGTIREREYNEDDPQSIPEAKLRSRFSSFTFSMAPKLKFGDEEASLVLIPQYNIGKINSRGDFLVYNGNLYAFEARERFSEAVHFWSFAAGIEGDFLGAEFIWFSLLLKYSLINSENAIDGLDFSDYNLSAHGGSAGGLGFSFRIYADIFSIFDE